MAKFTANLTTAAPSAFICNVTRRRGDANAWCASVFFGVGSTTAFGGATVGLQFSPDGGTTKFAAKDFTGNALTATAAGMANTQPFGDGVNNADIIGVYAVLTVVGTNAIVPVVLFDNR